MIDNKYRRKEVIDAPYIPKVIIIYSLHPACLKNYHKSFQVWPDSSDLLLHDLLYGIIGKVLVERV